MLIIDAEGRKCPLFSHRDLASRIHVRNGADCVEKVCSCDACRSLIQSLREAGLRIMMGHRQVEQALFYEFSLERHVPTDHLLRSIDRLVELGELRRELAPFYSAIGRPSIDPELVIRMLIVEVDCPFVQQS